MTNLDIRVSGNLLGGRQGFAYACNSGDFTVIPIEIDNATKEGGTFHKFGTVRIPKSFNGRSSYIKGSLECSEGKWMIGGYGCCIKSDFGFNDMDELVSDATSPVVEPGKPFVVAWIFREIGNVSLNFFKIDKVDPHCTVIANLIPLSDEEMESIRKDAKEWCLR